MTTSNSTVHALSITADGVTVWQAGTWNTQEEALAWMDEHDELIGDLCTDFARECRTGPQPDQIADIDVLVVTINVAGNLGWGTP